MFNLKLRSWISKKNSASIYLQHGDDDNVSFNEDNNVNKFLYKLVSNFKVVSFKPMEQQESN